MCHSQYLAATSSLQIRKCSSFPAWRFADQHQQQHSGLTNTVTFSWYRRYWFGLSYSASFSLTETSRTPWTLLIKNSNERIGDTSSSRSQDFLLRCFRHHSVCYDRYSNKHHKGSQFTQIKSITINTTSILGMLTTRLWSYETVKKKSFNGRIMGMSEQISQPLFFFRCSPAVRVVFE